MPDAADKVKIYLNGTVGATTDTHNAALDYSEPLYIGSAYGGGSVLNGLLDNIRISKGAARYTDTFNPPEVRTFIPRAILL
jgi:hypothetical protein